MSTNNWNGWPFYANPNAASDQVPCSQPKAQAGAMLVFAGVAGTVPPFSALNIGQQAANETTNEEWFVNSSYAWQQTQGV